MCMYVWTKSSNVSAHNLGVCLGGSTETEWRVVPTAKSWIQDAFHIRRVYRCKKKKKKKKRNLVPSVHVVLHLRPCICSRSSFYRWLLLYKPGSGPWVISRHFRRLEPFFSELLTTSLVQTERKTQMLGLELSGLTGEHVVHFHFESFLIVCLPKRPEENV